MKAQPWMMVTLSLFAIAGCYVTTSTAPPVESTNTRSGASVQRFGSEAPPKPMRLANGKSVPVVAIAPLVFAEGGDPPALHLTYITRLPITDTAALKKEANMVWSAFQKQVEASENPIGLVTAQETATAPDGTHGTYTFGWEKGGDGGWRGK